MPTDGSEGASLEDRVLAVLGSGTPLADGLRERLTELISWLVAETAKDPGADDLLDALMTLRLRDPARARRSGSWTLPQETVPAGTDELGTGAGAAGDGPGGAAVAGDETGAGLSAGELGMPGTEAGSQDAAAADQRQGQEAEPQPPTPAEVAAGELTELWKRLRIEQDARQYCAVYEQAEGQFPNDGVGILQWLWRRLHLVCLRLPVARAAEIREQAAALVAAAGYQDPLPAPLPEIRPDDDGPEQAELRELSSTLSRWPWLAETVLCLNWLAWHDEGVMIAHYETYVTGIARFTPRLRELFTKILTGKVRDLGRAGQDSRQEAELLAQLDAMLRGVVPIPLPMAGSWWTDSLDRSRDLLRSHPGASRVKLLPLDLSNADAWRKNFGDDAVNIDPAQTAGGTGKTGDRVWMLRYPVDGDNGLQKGRHISVK